MKPHLLSHIAHLSDGALLLRVKRLAARERTATALLVAHLAELDARRLYLGEGCSSLFSYCTQVLHLSEHAAYGRIEAARAARRYPVVLTLLAEGAVTLTAVGLLAPHLTEENHRDLLEAARHQSKRQVEELVARLHPQPEVPAVIRRLPSTQPVVAATAASGGPAGELELEAGVLNSLALPPAGSPGSVPTSVSVPTPTAVPAPRVSVTRMPTSTIVALAPERYKVQFTASRETVEKLRQAQALLRHQVPDGEVGAIIDRALTVLLERLLEQKVAATDRPRTRAKNPPAAPAGSGGSHGPAREDNRAAVTGPRYIPAEVRRAVWERDGGQCAFISRTGRRCEERGFLEFHHVKPYAARGEATVENIELRCRAHNGYEAEQIFGVRAVRETGEHVDKADQYPSGIKAGPHRPRAPKTTRMMPPASSAPPATGGIGNVRRSSLVTSRGPTSTTSSRVV